MTFLPFGLAGQKLKALKAGTQVPFPVRATASHATLFRNCYPDLGSAKLHPPIVELIPY